MARSILPSTSRHAARVRPLIHRQARHRTNASVRALLKDPTLWDDGAADEPDDSHFEIRAMVSRRRSADKLNHFERWAVARTGETPAEHRLGHLAGVLPPGLIGEHAMSHLEDRRELMTPEQYRLLHSWRFMPRREQTLLDRGELAELLRAVLAAPGGHRLFNHTLRCAAGHDELAASGTRRVRVPARFARLLRGMHDVRPFLAELALLGDHTIRRAVDRFVRCFKATRDAEQAAVAAGFPGPR